MPMPYRWRQRMKALIKSRNLILNELVMALEREGETGERYLADRRTNTRGFSVNTEIHLQ